MTSSVSGNVIYCPCFRILRVAWDKWFVYVHERMLLSRAVVTQLVTRHPGLWVHTVGVIQGWCRLAISVEPPGVSWGRGCWPVSLAGKLQQLKDMRAMPDEDQSGQPQRIEDWIGKFISRVPKLYARDQVSSLISMTAFIEGAIVRLILAYFASDKAKASYLADNIVDRITLDRKLATLKYVLRQNAWEGEFPHLITQLRKLFSLRNDLAHSFLDDEVREEGDDTVFTTYSWRDGDYKEVSVSLNAIANINKTAEAIILENLMTIISRIESGGSH